MWPICAISVLSIIYYYCDIGVGENPNGELNMHNDFDGYLDVSALTESEIKGIWEIARIHGDECCSGHFHFIEPEDRVDGQWCPSGMTRCGPLYVGSSWNVILWAASKYRGRVIKLRSAGLNIDRPWPIDYRR